MTDGPDDSFAAALFRLLAERPGVRALGVLVAEPGGCRLLAGTEALGALRPAGAAPLWPSPPPDLPLGPQRIDPRTLGLAAAFAALVPVAAATGERGWLVVADRAPRRLTPSLAQYLANAAALAVPLLSGPRGPARSQGRADGREAVPRTFRPRAAAERLIEAAVEERPASDRVGLVLLDLDRFRSINEALGTAAGDAILSVIGSRLERSLADDDRLVRLEGDRFVVVTRRPQKELRTLAERLLSAVSRPIVLGGRTVVMKASIGIASAAGGEPRTPLLLLHAETALRRAKVEGQAGCVIHEPVRDGLTLETSRLELDLADATRRGEMRLDFQPYIDLRSGRVCGAEALIRWRHPVRGELAPATFIPLAEASGLILPLGRWALREALRKARSWPAELSLSVNISPLEFHQPGFLGEIDAALLRSGFPPGRLELEITESVLVRDNPETTATLEALISRGVRIAIDDFGTGYSALAYLARLPHHRIKLDKAFVQDLANPATAALVRAIIALAQAKGVDATAEGVERPEDLALVRRAGFTHAQGYATGLPVPDPAERLRRAAAAPVT